MNHTNSRAGVVFVWKVINGFHYGPAPVGIPFITWPQFSGA